MKDCNLNFSKKDFIEHTKRHIKNVRLLANAMIEEISRDIRLLDYYNIRIDKNIKKKIRKIIRTHDKAKLCRNTLFLKKYNLKKPIIILLYFYIGKSLRDFPELKGLIDLVNKIDDEISAELFLKLKCDDSFIKFYKKLEKMADYTERGCNPLTEKEMGKKIIKASEFLKSELTDDEISLIKRIENKYFEIVRDK